MGEKERRKREMKWVGGRERQKGEEWGREDREKRGVGGKLNRWEVMDRTGVRLKEMKGDTDRKITERRKV